MRLLLFLSILVLASPDAAIGFEKWHGQFSALQRCEAYQSKNKQTNPGGIETEPGRNYRVMGVSPADDRYVQIRVPGAPVTVDRWVHVDCGTVSAAGKSSENVLVLNWEPSFCEPRLDSDKCRRFIAGAHPAAATRLTIHGLWPQPRGTYYCGVPRALVELDRQSGWSRLPELSLDDETRAELEIAMPGVDVFLDRHQWIKHGTCYDGEGDANDYFADTLFLTRAINDSAIGAFFAENIGARVQAETIRDLFDRTFGAGSGERVRVTCEEGNDRTLILALWIHLSGVIDADTDISELMAAADPVPIGCRSGVIAEVERR